MALMKRKLSLKGVKILEAAREKQYFSNSNFQKSYRYKNKYKPLQTLQIHSLSGALLWELKCNMKYELVFWFWKFI